MSLTDDLALALQNGGVGTLAESIFSGRLPDLPAGDPSGGLVSVLLSPAAEVSVRAMGPSLTVPSLERPRVQVVIRGASFSEAEAKAALAMSALDNLGPVTLNGLLYQSVEALQRPAFFLEADAQDRHVFAFNCSVTRSAA